MKNTRAVWMLIVSAILGVAVTAMAVVWVSQKGSIASTKVAVATMDIELGSRLTPQMLAMIDWPSGSLPQGAFADIKSLQDRVVKTSIQRGEAILNAKLAPLGTQGGLSAVIADGKRAMTVRVNDVVGVAGFALPGNYVDVMVNAQQDKAGRADEGKQISKTVLEHVLVLAVAQEAGRDETKPKVVNAVTLELSPEDAERLDLARSVGTLTLVLRNQVDKASVMSAGITKQQLFDRKEVLSLNLDNQPATVRPVVRVVHRVMPMKTTPAPKRMRDCVEVFHNNARTLNCF